MQDRQLRLAQRPVVQTALLLPNYALKRAGTVIDHDGEIKLVGTQGVMLLKGVFTLNAAASTGAWTIELTLDVPDQVFGTWGMTGSVIASTSAMIASNVITALSSFPAAVAGDVLTIQGVL